MKLASDISRYLLGIVFLIFGINGFLHFIPTPPMSATGMQFFFALAASHCVVAIFAMQIALAVLLLANRYVPLTLVLLAPIVANIFLFHALMAPAGLPAPIALVILWTIIALRDGSSFDGLLQRSVSA